MQEKFNETDLALRLLTLASALQDLRDTVPDDSFHAVLDFLDANTGLFYGRLGNLGPREKEVSVKLTADTSDVSHLVQIVSRLSQAIEDLTDDYVEDRQKVQVELDALNHEVAQLQELVRQEDQSAMSVQSQMAALFSQLQK